VNFLNKANAADERVYQLLNDKFKLFDGVFGASDEVLGSIESGIDFEKRIAAIYQKCRNQEEIQTSFYDLQKELEGQIGQEMDKAWKEYDEAAKDIDKNKDKLIDETQKRLGQKIVEERLFIIRWSIK